MKALFFLTAILTAVSLQAQQASDTTNIRLWTIYPGYVITHEGDTIQGFIKLNNLIDNQRKALFYNDPEDKKYTEKYKPKDIKAYKTGPRLYESFKFRPTNEDRGYHFFLKILDGPVSLYRWYYEPQSRSEERLKIDENNIANSKIDLSFSEADLNSELIAIKNEGEPVKLDQLKYLTNFKKNMSKFLADDRELAQKIARKEKGYRYENLIEIIKEYNEWYLKNH